MEELDRIVYKLATRWAVLDQKFRDIFTYRDWLHDRVLRCDMLRAGTVLYCCVKPSSFKRVVFNPPYAIVNNVQVELGAEFSNVVLMSRDVYKVLYRATKKTVRKSIKTLFGQDEDILSVRAYCIAHMIDVYGIEKAMAIAGITWKHGLVAMLKRNYTKCVALQ